MEVIEVSAQVDRAREGFFRLVFGDSTGYLCIAYAPKSMDRSKFREQFFKYPEEIPTVLRLVNEVYQSNNVWYCPQLMSTPRRTKETVEVTTCAWSDLDTCQPSELYLEPSILIESSPKRWQGLWKFDQHVDPDVAESISQRIAYKHAEHGADRSGWDLTQLLRMPYTYNFKYGTTPIVKIENANRKRYRPSDWDKNYDKVTTFETVDIPMPDVSHLDPDELLDKHRLQISPTIWRLYQEPLKEGERSEALWKLMMYLFEAGFDEDVVFAICQEAKCNKYENRGAPLVQLWKDVVRAKSNHIANTNAFQAIDKEYVEAPLVTDDERRRIAATPTFIERYIEWAKSLGDAAPQYHQAGAFTVLSALLAGAVRLPTSFGTIKPNLWFMILADTTLTRKSTAMDIATDLLMEIDDDAVMATDGSLEGLLTSLSTRPGRPSIFLRDEFSGLLEMITKKDYYAGMPEFLTKLYDGKMQKRVLRKESVEVRDPCLLVFAGGIKNKITSLLTFEHVSSGFMPRFVFITAESDITRVRPLGPPTDFTDNNRTAILDELMDITSYYHQTQEMTVTGTKIHIEEKVKFLAELTPGAWLRYNELESQLLDAGMKTDRADIMTPVYDRLAKSILKAAVLLSATRQKANPVVVSEEDIIRAAVYGESWRLYAREVMDNVGKGGAERQLDTILRRIHAKPGVSRSSLMQSYHLNARDATAIFETLEQRGLIVRTKNGKAETYYPSEIKIKERL